MRTIRLLPGEISVLDRQDPTTENDGGWQQLLVQLQTKVERATGDIVLDADDLERIPRYAFDYGNGGWESRLSAIFSRSLGQSLGRASRQA
jgi:hypothetical protein